VFVLQSVNYGVGGGGGGIGYDGINYSVGVKLDSFCNAGPEICENINLGSYGYAGHAQTSNYAGIVENGNIFSHGNSYISCTSLPGTGGNPFVYADGRVTYVWIDYINGYWNVYLSKISTKPVTPVINNYYLLLSDLNIYPFGDNIVGTVDPLAIIKSKNGYISNIIADGGDGTLISSYIILSNNGYISNIIADGGDGTLISPFYIAPISGYIRNIMYDGGGTLISPFYITPRYGYISNILDDGGGTLISPFYITPRYGYISNILDDGMYYGHF
jgi:hypothetical protein